MCPALGEFEPNEAGRVLPDGGDVCTPRLCRSVIDAGIDLRVDEAALGRLWPLFALQVGMAGVTCVSPLERYLVCEADLAT